MQSVASLMSIGKTDIGVMEDVEEVDEESSKDFSSRLSEITSEFAKLESHHDGNPFGNPFEDDLDLECDFCGIVCLAFFSFFLYNFDYLQLLLCFLNIVILVCWKFEKFSELHDTCICYLTISSEVNNARSEYNTKKRKSVEF